jgi:hypothetical protein
MERAWQQIEAAGTPEVKSQLYNEALEWTMLDKNYEQRTSTVFVGPIFLPIWWGNFDPGYRPAPAVAGAPHAVPAASGGRSAASIPGAAFAASVVTGVKGFSSHVLGNLGSFTSGVTTRTNPAPLASSAARGHWSGGGVGGGHCACACACAGCACACAGGGR